MSVTCEQVAALLAAGGRAALIDREVQDHVGESVFGVLAAGGFEFGGVDLGEADAVRADEMFSILMGSSVEDRRSFIERHALEVSDLDI